jgi:gamma-glutamyltranspeptidase/glutathione hydrolase
MRDADDRPRAINGSGWAGERYELSQIRSKIGDAVELTGAHRVTIPGSISAWFKLISDHGKSDWKRVLAPAIQLAEEGYCVTERLARDWALQKAKLQANSASAAVFLPHGRCPAPGDICKNPKLARTLRLIADGGAKAFYRGEIAEAMVESLRDLEGEHTIDDFESFEAEYCEPVSCRYRGFQLWECPPNGQGAVALIMARLLDSFDVRQWKADSADRMHLQAEIARLAYAARDFYFADPRKADVPVSQLLSDEFLSRLRSSISITERMREVEAWRTRPHKHTVYISVVDRDRTTVSLMNSLYDDFGSGITCPRTGILFHDRGAAFSLEPSSPNALGGRKRPMHTIIPAILTASGKPILSFGVTGGHFQPLGQMQILSNILDYEMPVQAALDCPRMFAIANDFHVERGMPEPTISELIRRGHNVTFAPNPLGACQAIYIDRNRGTLEGGSDTRRDGVALGY